MPKKRKGERPNGLIQVSCSIGRKPDGSLNRKFFYGRSRAEAERKRDEYLQSLREEKRVNPQITVSEWVDQYLSTYLTSVNPLYKNINYVPYNRIKNNFGSRLLRSITEIDLQSSLNALAGKSFSTITKYKQALQRVFRKAYKNKLIADDPSDDLQTPAYTKNSHVALSRDIINLIVSNYQHSPAGLWILLMLFTGLRRGEMIALQWDCIDLTERTLTVKRTAVIQSNAAVIQDRAKTAAGIRVIPIPSTLYDALTAIPETHRTGFVCLSANGKPLTEHAISRGLERFCNILTRIINDRPINPNRANSLTDLPRVSIRTHDLRHTYATLLYDAGVDVKTAAYLLGHSDIRVTMDIYTHLSEERKAKSTSELLLLLDTFKP